MISSLLLALALAAQPAAEPPPAEAWTRLAEARARLESGPPLVADFEQEYLPSGFGSGDLETGTMALSLPRCLRWDYADPYPKSYLLCDRVAWSWNPGDASGRRQVLSDEDQAGLDLMRLSVEDLRRSYRAALEQGAEGLTEISLAPLGEGGEIASASLSIDSASGRVLSASFVDAEGNLTRFRLSGYRAAPAGSGLFDPPPDLVWLED